MSVFLTKIKVDPESWWKILSIKQLKKRKFSRTTWHDQDQKYNFLILGPFQCSFCKYPQLYWFIKWQQKTTARQNLYRTISLHINGGGKIYLNRDMEKPGSFDHFPKGTGCMPWFFRISADTILNCAFYNSRLNKKKKSGLHLYERNCCDLDYKCSQIASERGNMAILE